MANLFHRIFGSQKRRERVIVVRKVKHSNKPAQTKATHGTVILRGKIEEDFKVAK